MNTPLANKTTISSRNKMSHIDGGQKENLTNLARQSSIPHTSQIARNRALQPPSAATTRLANLANCVPSSIKDGSKTSSDKQTMSTPKPPVTTSKLSRHSNSKPTFQQPANRLIPHTTNKPTRNTINKTAIPSTSSRILAPQARLGSAVPLASRSSSLLSSVSSATASKRPSVSCNAAGDGKQQNSASNQIPDTIAIRKGLAKFSNPIECQRQHQALSLKIRQLNDIVAAREKEVDELRDQLKRSIDFGIGYATTVQYFALRLKLNSETDLVTECEQLKSRVGQLVSSERQYNDRLDAVVEDYKNQLKAEQDLKNNLAEELKGTHLAHSEELKRLNGVHQEELHDLIEKHSATEKGLQDRIQNLETELRIKNTELMDLGKEHELLSNSYNKLEESLTKDKDARVKYAQERITQLQKDVDSLNSVIEIRSERIRVLEKDGLLLKEVQNELLHHKDNEKALKQQLESLNAALVKKREQLEKLRVEHEELRQELKRECTERRRMTMKTEMLEWEINESNTSCVADNHLVYTSTMRDLDNLPTT